MKIRYGAAIVASFAVLLVSTVAPARAIGVGSLTPAQLQRFSRDLIPSNSQDFFRQGRAQLEQEVQRLDRQPLNSNERLLKVEPQIQGNDDRVQNGWQQRANPYRVRKNPSS